MVPFFIIEIFMHLATPLEMLLGGRKREGTLLSHLKSEKKNFLIEPFSICNNLFSK